MWPKKKKKKQPVDPVSDPSSIGNLVVDGGYMTKDEFLRMIEKFQEVKIEMLIGQFILSQEKPDGRRYITEDQLKILLMKQRNMRNGETDHGSVMEILDIAQRTQESMSEEVIEFASLMMKANGVVK